MQVFPAAMERYIICVLAEKKKRTKVPCVEIATYFGCTAIADGGAW